MNYPNARSEVSIFLTLGLALATAIAVPAKAIEIQAHFDTPGQPLPLRLNQASNGWTHSKWSQYYNDIGVQYRRMDHWNDAYAVVRRRPDGGLWYDFAALDNAIREATGGFSYKAYPTVDFCPACLDTDFLQNPIQLKTGSVHASLSPVGTLLMSGLVRVPDPSLGLLVGALNEAGMYEIDRKGNIIGRYPYQEVSFVTPSNRLVIKKDGNTYAILGPDRKEIAAGTGQILQELNGSSYLLASGPADASRKLSQIDLKGTVLQTFPGTYPGQVVLLNSGLLSCDNQELTLTDKTGAKRTIEKFSSSVHFAYLAANPNDTSGRFYAVENSHAPEDIARKNDAFSIHAFSSDGQPIWKTDLPTNGQDLRGAVASKDGLVIVGISDSLVGANATGPLWKIGARGSLDMQLLSHDGIESVVARTYEDEIDEFDVRTGDPLWRYGKFEDQTYWICNPPKDMGDWADQLHHYLKHYDKDLGLGWDRWELWNEPTPHGFFWSGSWQDYAAMLDASMKVVQNTDPGIVMDAYDGAGWWTDLIKYCNEHQVRLDGISWHGYRNGQADYDAQEKQDISSRVSSFPTYTGSKPLELVNTEWNLHPGQGEDLSKNYETGYYHAPFQAEMTYLMGSAGVKFSSEFAMVSGYTWPCGWMYAATTPVDGQTPPANSPLYIQTPAYNGARLWAMLPQNEAPTTNDFVPQMSGGTASHVTTIAASDPKKGEYGILIWNFSNQSKDAKDETVNLTCHFGSEGPLHMRHFIIDADHSTYTKDWDHRFLEAAESADKAASAFERQTVTLKKDSLHAFFFTRDPLKANAGKNVTVEVHHPVTFDGSGSTGLPAFYRWDVNATDGVDFPEPTSDEPSTSHLFGMKPVLVRGYDKPGTYTVTLRVSTDGYQKQTDTATTTVTVVPEKTAPAAPQNLTANCAKTDHQVFLQWEALNFAQNPDVAGYTIYRKDGTGDWKKLTSAPPATSYVDSGVAEKVPYSYRVTAFDSSGNEGAPSPEIQTVFQVSHKAPATPAGLKAAIVGGDTVKLDWDNVSLTEGACVTGFNVYRRTAGSGDWQKLTDKPTFYKRYYDDVTNPGMAGHYEYCVTALDTFKNESLQSDAIAPAAK